MSEWTNPVVGVVRVATGRADGMARFGTTVQAFLSSLAPLVAFPIVTALLELMGDGLLAAVWWLLLTLVAQLAPLVLSHVLAARWGREAAWTHYATAYNWCCWALPVVGVGLFMVFGVAAGAGLPNMVAAKGVLIGLAGYSLWLHWFLARRGLDLSPGRAIILVVLVNLGTLLLVFGPTRLG